MPAEVQMYSCPRCKRGQFRAFPGLNGKAYCPWCGDAVAPAADPAPSASDDPPLPELSLEELANRMSGNTAIRVAPSPAAPAAPAAPPAPPSPDLQAKLAESERRREAAESELRKELEKKGEIKKAVMAEIGRLEAELTETRDRIRRKDVDHAAALESLNVLVKAREDGWNGDRMRSQDTVDQKEKALRALEIKLEERSKAATEMQSVLDASRTEVGKLHAQVAATETERAELRKKLSGVDAKLQSLKDAPAQLKDLRKRLEESEAKSTAAHAELEKRDKRIKELQLLIKTLGERLNDLSDRPHPRPTA